MHVSKEGKYSAIIAGEQHLAPDNNKRALIADKNKFITSLTNDTYAKAINAM